MKIKKIYLIAICLAIIKFVIAFAVILYNKLDFGFNLIGWDELQWQNSSIFFFENGLNVDSIKISLAMPGAFNNAGWPYLVAIVHEIFGLSYANVLIIRTLLYLFAVCGLFKLLRRSGHGGKVACWSIFFLSIYHPFVVADATYLRDDILVYLIIILLDLATVRGIIKGILAAILFAFLAYILILSRPFAFFVFLSLYLFYFNLFRFIHLIFAVPLLFTIPFLAGDLYEYSFNFLSTLKLNMGSILFLSLKYYFGPLPWQMIGVDSGYNPIWYIVTLSLILFCLLIKQFYLAIIKNWKVLAALFLAGALPYIISNQEVDAVGPRQFAMVGPFLFFIIYGDIIQNLSFRQPLLTTKV